jgi:hypothetical protein
MTPPRCVSGLRQRGAALLLAMTLLALVASLAAGMVWLQWRAVQVEAAERSRGQSAWILAGALDWTRLILREDARSGAVDHAGEPWATPLAEARLSSFLAANREATADSEVEAFLAGSITDAQARYNLRNLFADDGRAVPQELLTLNRLCATAGLRDRHWAGQCVASPHSRPRPGQRVGPRYWQRRIGHRRVDTGAAHPALRASGLAGPGTRRAAGPAPPGGRAAHPYAREPEHRQPRGAGGRAGR